MRVLTVPRPLRWPIRALSRLVSPRPFDAVTVGRTILVLCDDPSAALLRHEVEHVRQANRLGLWRFWWEYLREMWRNGYEHNRFEVEARKAAGQEPRGV